MKDLYYNLDDAEFVDQSGEKLSRFVPELFYQENAVWRIFLRDRDNHPRDLSGIVAWSAAVDRDYDAATAPMCRVTPDRISADAVTGAVTVNLDAATAEFLAAVDGTAKRRAFFELHGLTAAGDRELYLGFEICARMILDPSPGVPQQVPEIFATRIYADLTARQIAEEVMSSGGQVSGALVSGAEIVTTVGSCTFSYTSNGGFAVSGGGVELKVQSGAVVASGAGGEKMVLSGGKAIVGVDHEDNPMSLAIDPDSGVFVDVAGAAKLIRLHYDNNALEITPDGVEVNSAIVATEPWANSNFARRPVTSADSGTEAYIGVLSGGTNYVCTSALYSLIVDSVAKSTEASFIHFSLDSVTATVPVAISGFTFDSGRFEDGKEYLVGFFDGMAVVNEVTSGGVLS